MRHPLQPIVCAVLLGCLLALVAAGSRLASPTQHQRVYIITPTEAGAATAKRPAGGLTSPASTPARVLPTLTPELGAKFPQDTPDDAAGGAPVAPDVRDARPPRRPETRATTDTLSLGAGAHTAGSTLHTVKAGDTVYELAAQYGVSPEAILSANSLDEQGARSLDIGQGLVIPVSPEGDRGQQPPPGRRVVHQVQAGEALTIIARDYGTTVESIVFANDLEDAEFILAGQELIVPVPTGTEPSPAAEPVSGTDVLTQTDALAAAPQHAPVAPVSPTLALTQSPVVTQTDTAAPVSPTLALTQALAVTQTDAAGMALAVNATEPISAAEPLAVTPAITETILNEPVTDTVGIEEAPPELLVDAAQAEADPVAELATLEAAMLGAVNAEREAHGLPPYRLDEVLAAVARAHAQDMAARDYVGHASPEGERVRGRLLDEGVDLDRVGENYYVTTRPAAEAVAHTLSWFLDDPPHRHNILHDYYTRIGVGVAYKPPGWYIFVLDFAVD